VPASKQKTSLSLIWKLLIALAAVGIVVLVWQLTPLADVAKPQRLARMLDSVEDHRWAPLIFVGAYLVGGLVAFPVTVLGAAVAITLPPLKAVPVAFTGIMLSAALHHWIGARFFREKAGSRLTGIRQKLEEAMTDQSIVTLAALRMVPIAPFTFVNVAAGAIGVRFRDFMLGTALGLAPSITIVCLFGRQVRQFWKDPSGTGVALIVAVGLAWIGLAFCLQRFVARRKSRPSGNKGDGKGKVSATPRARASNA
jgi:phospholipase D1/2